MHGDCHAFYNSVAATPLVRNGANEKLSPSVTRDGVLERHTIFAVLLEMMYQIAQDYPGLPDVRTLKAHEIRFFYEGLRGGLLQHTRPK